MIRRKQQSRPVLTPERWQPAGLQSPCVMQSDHCFLVGLSGLCCCSRPVRCRAVPPLCAGAKTRSAVGMAAVCRSHCAITEGRGVLMVRTICSSRVAIGLRCPAGPWPASCSARSSECTRETGGGLHIYLHGVRNRPEPAYMQVHTSCLLLPDQTYSGLLRNLPGDRHDDPSCRMRALSLCRCLLPHLECLA